MQRSFRRLLGVSAAFGVLAVAGCTGADTAAPGHSHVGGAMISLPVGDGTTAEEVGYRLEDVSLPERAGVAGELSFRVMYQDQPQTAYLEELTKDLHLYVVSADLTVFRHLHPTRAEDGTWSTPVMLPTGGDYRVIAEFVAEDGGGNGDHLVLGETVPVGEGATSEVDEVDPGVQVDVRQAPAAGPNGRMLLRVRDPQGRPVRLGTYLGTYGHVTGFHHETGAMVHVHPLTAPEVTEAGTTLEFHTEIAEAGDYRLFAQVRIDGFLHTVPVELEVGGTPA